MTTTRLKWKLRKFAIRWTWQTKCVGGALNFKIWASCRSPNYPPGGSTEGGMGVYWIHPGVCLFVRLKTTRFPELFEKTIGSIHFIPVIYPYGVSLLTPIHFRVPSLIFGPLVAKYLAENGVSGTFWKNYWPNSLHSWHLPLWGESLDPYTFSCS